MDSSPQSNMVDVLDVHDINMETLALAAAEKNNEEEAAAEEKKDSTHPEIIIISDDESPTEEGGVEISQPQVNQRGVVLRRWTISEDCKLVRLICVRRLRWQKLMNHEDRYTNFRWSRLDRFLPVTRDYVFDHWRHHVMNNRRYCFSATAFVDHPVGTNSSVQNLQNNERIISSTPIVGPMITYPILGQGSECFEDAVHSVLWDFGLLGDIRIE
ncbi:hypothetical protein Tco_0558949 [Tanacetum coccineum]